jgi:hypothetical protein
VTFETDGSGVQAGWSASWYSEFCSGGTTLTTKSGSLDDGSGDEDYGNNATCSWTISPDKADSIVLSFSAFGTESGADLVTIYDGTSDSDPVLATLSGSSLPADVVSTGGDMHIVFASNSSVSGGGWSASYTSGRRPGPDFTGLTSTVVSSMPHNIENCEYYFGGASDDRLFYVFQDSNGDFYFVGDTESWGTGMEDLVVMKTDNALNELWTKTYGSTDSDYYPGAALTSDDQLVLTGRTNGFSVSSHDGMGIKLDASGNVVDAYRISDSGPYQEHNGVMLDDDGNYYFLGGNSSNHGMENNITVVDTSMTRLWYLNFGTKDASNNDTNDILYEGVQYDDTTIFVVGYVREPEAQLGDFDIGVSRINIETETLDYIKIYNDGSSVSETNRATDVLRTSDDKILVAGYTQTWGVGSTSYSDGFLMKVEPDDGSVIWLKTYGGDSVDVFHSILETPDGAYLAVGRTNDAVSKGSYDGFVVKTDTAGTEIWSKTYGSTGNDALRNAIILNDHTLLFVGDSDSDGAGNRDFWMVKTDEDGCVGTDVDQSGSFAVGSETPTIMENTTNATGASTWLSLSPTEDTGTPAFLGCVDPYPYPGGVQEDLALWLNACDSVYADNASTSIGATPTTNGIAVNAWRNIYQGTTTDATTFNSDLDAPYYYNNSTINLNFNPVVRFDGYDDALDFYDSYIFTSKAGMEMLAVVDTDPESSGNVDMVLDIGLLASAGYGIGYSADGSAFYACNTGTENFLSNAHAANDDPVILRGSLEFGGLITEYWDGVLKYSDNMTLSEITTTEIQESSTHGESSGPLTIGRQAKNYSYTDRAFDGNMAEIIVYDDTLSANDIAKVESYLAIKYGITKNGNYVNHAGEVLWDATSNSDYHNNVVGIGRDDYSGLMQKQSRSIASDSFITIGLGDIDTVNTANTGTFGCDQSFLLAGHKGTDNTFAVDAIGGEFQKKINKEWKIEKIRSVGTVEVGVDTTGIGLNGCEHLYMVVDTNNSGDFTTADDMAVMTRDGGMYTCDYQFDDGDLVSFVKYEDAVYLELPGYNTTINADEYCNLAEGDYTYYYDVEDPEKLRFAIEKFPGAAGANTSAFEAAVTITTKNDPTTASGLIRKEDALNEQATYYLGRYWNVELVSGTLNGWVNMRFYFDAQDTAVAKTAADQFNETYSNSLPMSSLVWFKSVNESFDTTKLDSFGYNGNSIVLTDYTYGVEDGITYVEFSNITSFSGGGGKYGVGNGTLPVTLIHFSAMPEERGIILSWSTSTEYNTEKFVVQRSADLQNWTEMGVVAAAGFSKKIQQYQIADRSPLLGVNYYRLKIVDFDGYTEYSENRFASYRVNLPEIQLYPNPARDQFHVKVQAEDVWFELYNPLGRSETIELELRDGVYTFSTHHLAKGMYFLKVHTPGREETVKVVLE